MIELGSELFVDRHADGSTSDYPMSYVAVFRRGENGRLRLLVDCVSPDDRTDSGETRRPASGTTVEPLPPFPGTPDEEAR